MICLVLPLLIGFGIDCVLGDPHSLPHPVVLIGKTISALECVLRRIFAKTPRGERAAGAVLWLIVAFLAAAVPALPPIKTCVGAGRSRHASGAVPETTVRFSTWNAA